MMCLRVSVLVAFLGLTLAQVNPYISCRVGTLPVVISAPHGGYLEPDEIPDRTQGCLSSDGRCTWRNSCSPKTKDKCVAATNRDSYTQELTNEIRDELYNLYGKHPYVVINKLARWKLDANRDIEEAAFGNSIAEEADNRYHYCIEYYKNKINRPSLYLDIHAHGHALQYAELGYQITKTRLNDSTIVDRYSSLRRLLETSSKSTEEIVRGETSFGKILEDQGFAAIPSPSKPRPLQNPYFMGGYNNNKHGSKYGGLTDGIQIESPSDFRFDETKRKAYAKALAKTIQIFLRTHYDYE